MRTELRLPCEVATTACASDGERVGSGLLPASLIAVEPAPSARADDLHYFALRPPRQRVSSIQSLTPLPIRWIRIPTVCERLLANVEIGYFGSITTQYQDDLNPNADRTIQRKAGFTTDSGSQFSPSAKLIMTYDLRKYEIPDGQFVVGFSAGWSTYDGAAPNSFNLNAMYWYRGRCWTGRSSSRSATSTARNSSDPSEAPSPTTFSVPTTGSMDKGARHQVTCVTTPLPGVVVKYNFSKDIYWLSTIQRSESPDGNYPEYFANRNGFCLLRTKRWRALSE